MSPSTNPHRNTPSIRTSFLSAREAILGRQSPPAPPARHPPPLPLSTTRRARKAPAYNTSLRFSSGLIHASAKSSSFRWAQSGGPSTANDELVVFNGSNAHSQGSSSTSDRSIEDSHDSLAMALYHQHLHHGSSSNPPDAIRTALSRLPPSARPFTFTFTYVPRSTAIGIKNLYAPTFVKGRGWVDAFGGSAADSSHNEKTASYFRVQPSAITAAAALEVQNEKETRYPVRTRSAKTITAVAPDDNQSNEKAPSSAAVSATHSQSNKVSHKSKAQQKARAAKAAAAAAAALTTSAPMVEEHLTPPSSSLPAKRKRARVQEDGTSKDGDDFVPQNDAVDQGEEQEGRATRASKRRKTDMPPPPTIPSHHTQSNTAKSAKKAAAARDDSASANGDAEETNTSSNRRRSTRKGKETTPVDSSMDVEVNEKVTANNARALRARAREGSETIKPSPPPEKEKRAPVKKAFPPPDTEHVEISAGPSSSSSQPTTTEPPKHTYSTRRAGAISKATSRGGDKERTSPSGSDETLVGPSIVPDSTKLAINDSRHQPRMAVV